VELSRDPSFEVMGSTWLCLEAEMLNDALRECGVSKKDLRQKIVTQLLCDRGTFLDQKYFVVEGQRRHPDVMFTTRPIQPSTEVTEPGTVFMKSSYFSFAEYSGTNAMYFFEDSAESNADIEVGLVGDDEDGEDPSSAKPAKKPSGKKKKRG
jgi:hypothetical protein